MVNGVNVALQKTKKMKKYVELALARVDNYQSVDRTNVRPTPSMVEEVFFPVTINGHTSYLMEEHENAPHIELEVPQVTEFVVRVSDEKGYLRDVDLCDPQDLDWLDAHGLCVDGQKIAEGIAASIYGMWRDALIKDSLTFEDLEEGLRYYIGVVNHANICWEVKQGLKKILYKALKKSALRDLYKDLKNSLRKRGVEK